MAAADQTTTPTVGFVIPTHGSPRLVLEAIASVKRQTHPVQEIVVAVDGKPDLTSSVLAREHPDVTVRPSVGQLNAAGTRNRAIRAATSDWLFFLDSDDLAHEERVAATLAFLSEHPHARAVRAPLWLFSERESGPEGAWGLQRDFVAPDLDACHAAARTHPARNDFSYLDILGRSHEMMLTRNLGAISSTAVERVMLIKAGLPREDLHCGDDWTMFVNVARQTEWYLMPSAVTFQRLHGAQHTRSGGAAIALGIIDARRKVWAEERTFALADYGVEHAYELRDLIRHQLRAHRLWTALRLLWAGWPLIPRWDDRMSVLMPPGLSPSRQSRPRHRVDD